MSKHPLTFSLDFATSSAAQFLSLRLLSRPGVHFGLLLDLSLGLLLGLLLGLYLNLDHRLFLRLNFCLDFLTSSHSRLP